MNNLGHRSIISFCNQSGE